MKTENLFFQIKIGENFLQVVTSQIIIMSYDPFQGLIYQTYATHKVYSYIQNIVL